MSLMVYAGITVLADQATKELVLRTLSLNESLGVIPGFFALTHIRNTGGAFGLLAGEATQARTLFFLAASVLALGMILFFYAKVAHGKPWAGAALAMICGGAVGNLIDRLRFGEVVDFLDFYVGTTHWPAFNIADSAISVGVGMLCFLVLSKRL